MNIISIGKKNLVSMGPGLYLLQSYALVISKDLAPHATRSNLHGENLHATQHF
jgi:hypothetical protein